jgi:hypothetical protein
MNSLFLRGRSLSKRTRWQLLLGLFGLVVAGRVADRFVAHSANYSPPLLPLGPVGLLLLASPVILLGWLGFSSARKAGVALPAAGAAGLTEQAEWYFANGKQQVGPLSTAQMTTLLRAGVLVQPATMVLKRGARQWLEAGQVGEFGFRPKAGR